MTVLEWLQQHEDDYLADAERECMLMKSDAENWREHNKAQEVNRSIAATFRLTWHMLPQAALDMEMEDNNGQQQI